MTNFVSFQDRIAGGLVGLLVGDALGVPYEFHAPETLPAADLIEYAPPLGFRRAHAGVPPGCWSDDGAQTLCLLASLLHCDQLDPTDLGGRLLNWVEHGYMAVDGIVFDVGIQTGEALRRIASGVAPLEAGGDAEHSKGNGSLMRVLPLALWHRGDDAALVADAHAQSRVTHGHVTVQACCALYCQWARRILEGAADPWRAAVAALRAIYGGGGLHAKALEGEIRPEALRTVRGSGFVIDCLFSARQALAAGSYEAVVRAAIALGNDTDTTACVAGGLAGLRDGLAAIPERWRTNLRGQDVLAPLCAELLATRISVADAMYMPGVAEIELKLPSRKGGFCRDVDLT